MKYLFLVSIILVGCDILPDTKGRELFSTQISNKKASIKVMYHPSNATIQAFIQVQRIVNDSIEVIEDYERYNCMDTCSLLNDTTFMLVIRDTVSVLGTKPDTMLIKL